TLTDLIRGIRANKKSEEAYIKQALDEIRLEVRRNDLDIKAVAVAKLFYLHMFGYDMSWASFHVVEVMSSPKYAHKRIGYIAAAISFKQDTDVLMLCTNLIKKDLSSNNFLETALALNGLCTIVTPDLGRDLAPDLISMLNHSRPYIRKRVILCLYKVFLKYPEALRVAFPRLKEKLDDHDPSVVSTAVTVICELARKNPKSYLSLAPQLYNLLTTSSNNWMLIKIVKLTTTAMSLLYECIHTVITGDMIRPEAAGSDADEGQDSALARLCVSKLKLFVEDPDQNLKYLGLLALCKLLPIRPRSVTEHRDIILECLDDRDISIRTRALELVSGMVTKKNVVDIVRRLMEQLIPMAADSPEDDTIKPTNSFLASENSYILEVVKRILSFCSKNTYELVTDFEWYVAALSRLVKIPRISVGAEISTQLVDVSVRVKEVRPFAVTQMFELITDAEFLDTSSLETNNVQVLYAAGWICGEFNEFLPEPTLTFDPLTSKSVTKLPPSIQAVYLHAAFKIYASWIQRSFDIPKDASISYQLLSLLDTRESDGNEWLVPQRARDFSILFSGELNPVGSKAQKRVPIPETLDLDKYIFEPEDDPEETAADSWSNEDEGWFGELSGSPQRAKTQDPAEQEKVRRQRAEQRKNDPFYIGDSISADVDSIPIVQLDISDIKKGSKSKSSTKGRKRTMESRALKTGFSINREDEMPDGAHKDELEEHDRWLNEPGADADTLAVLSVDLTTEHSGSDSRLHFEVGRAAVLSSPAPALSEALSVTRKKVDSKKKGKKKAVAETAAPSGETEVALVEEKKKPKKKKLLGEESKKTKKDRKTSAPPQESKADAVAVAISPTEAVLVDFGDAPNVESAFAAVNATNFLKLPTVTSVLHEDAVSAAFDWIVHGPPTNGAVSVSVSVVVTNSGGEALERATLDLASLPTNNVSTILPVSSSPVEDMPPNGCAKFDFVAVIALAKGGTVAEPTRFSGALKYFESSAERERQIELVLPGLVNLLPSSSTTDVGPEEFAAIAARAEALPVSASAHFPIPSLAAFSEVVASQLAPRLRLRIVEAVPGAVSVYGRSLAGAHVVGLIKVRPKGAKAASATNTASASGSGPGVVTVEMRAGDRTLLDALVEAVDEMDVF
ncbi:AP-3 complex subunit delta-1, partial [Cladochytrium tenue]